MAKLNKALTEQAEASTENETSKIMDVSISANDPLVQVKTMIGQSDVALSERLTDLLAKKNEVEAGPVIVLERVLKPIYCEPETDKDGNITGYKRSLDEFFPRPVSKDPKKGDDATGDDDVVTADKLGGNAPFSEYFTAYKPQKDGTKKPRRCNFFTEAYRDLSIGKAQAFVLEQCGHLLDDKGDRSKAEPKYRDMPLDKVANLRKRTTNDMSRGRKILRQAVGVFYVMQDATEYDDRIIIEYNGEDLESISESQYALNLVDVKRKRVSRPLTLGDVMKIDIPNAATVAGENGSLYDAINDQLARGKKEAEAEAATYAELDEAIVNFRRMINFFDIDDHVKALKSKMAKGRNGKPDELLVYEVGSFHRTVMQLWNKDLEALFQRIEDKQLQAAAKAA